MVAVVTNNRNGTVGQPLEEIGTTADDLIAWMTSTPDFKIVEAPHPATVGDITGTQLTLVTSETADWGQEGCDVAPRCVAILTDPKHWGGNYVGISGVEPMQIFVGDLPYDGGHTLVIAQSAEDVDDLRAANDESRPILNSLRLPDTFTAN
jgi:hypothetical protein